MIWFIKKGKKMTVDSLERNIHDVKRYDNDHKRIKRPHTEI